MKVSKILKIKIFEFKNCMTASIGPSNRKEFYSLGNKMLMEKVIFLCTMQVPLSIKYITLKKRKLRYKHDNCIGILVLQNNNFTGAKVNQQKCKSY